MAQAAVQQPAAAAPAAAAAPRPVAVHKSTAIIPGWSRPLSSQSLTIECQKITQPNRSVAAKESYGVMELEVMKFVAYCGGLTIKLRLDDLQHGPVDRCVCVAQQGRASGGRAWLGVAPPRRSELCPPVTRCAHIHTHTHTHAAASHGGWQPCDPATRWPATQPPHPALAAARRTGARAHRPWGAPTAAAARGPAA
jgi:hypothetical protein